LIFKAGSKRTNKKKEVVMLSKGKTFLNKKGNAAKTMLKSPQFQSKASNVTYKALPIPFRWFVGEKGTGSIISKLINAIFKK